MIVKNVDLATVLNTLADEVNLKILSFLSLYDELCVCDLQTLLSMTQSSVSRHLKALHDIDFISVRKDGRWRYYKLGRIPKFVNGIINLAIEEYKVRSDYIPNSCKGPEQNQRS